MFHPTPITPEVQREALEAWQSDLDVSPAHLAPSLAVRSVLGFVSAARKLSDYELDEVGKLLEQLPEHGTRPSECSHHLLSRCVVANQWGAAVDVDSPGVVSASHPITGTETKR